MLVINYRAQLHTPSTDNYFAPDYTDPFPMPKREPNDAFGAIGDVNSIGRVILQFRLNASGRLSRNETYRRAVGSLLKDSACSETNERNSFRS